VRPLFFSDSYFFIFISSISLISADLVALDLAEALYSVIDAEHSCTLSLDHNLSSASSDAMILKSLTIGTIGTQALGLPRVIVMS